MAEPRRLAGVALEEPFDRAALRERRRSAIVRAAGAAFGKAGFHNTSMDDLAAALRTSKPTLYQYFANKQSLLYACHELAMDHGEAGLRLAAQSDGSGLERLKIYCRRYMQGVMDEFGACIVLTDVDALLPADRQDVIARRARISQATRDMIGQGRADRSLGDVDPVAATMFVLGAMNWVLVWFRPDGPRSRDEIIDSFLAMFEHGLGRAP